MKCGWFIVLPFALVSSFALSQSLEDRASLRIQNSQYVSSGANYFRDGAGRDNTSISISLDKERRLFSGISGRLHLKDEYSATENWNYLNLYQLYAFKRVRGFDLSFGRKLELWSAADEEWKQGIIHSRHLQNRLKSESAGLFGLFIGQSRRQTSWSVGVLPLYIPDLGAHFSVADHRFVSRNPWFDPPVSSFRFRGQESAIRYSVNQPPAEKIAAHPGVIATIEQDTGAQSGIRFTAGYKPIPQLLLGFPSLNKVVVGANEDYLKVAVTPKVMYHTVAAAEGFGRLGRWSIAPSLTYDQVRGDGFDGTYTSQVYAPAWIWSFIASRALEEDGPYAARIKLGFLKINGGAKPDQGVFATERSLFEKRFQYDEAYLAALHLPLRRLFKNPLATEARIVYDRIQNAGYISFALGYTIAPRWRIDGEMDLLGLVGGSAEEPNGFFANYRANDRIGIGSSYVF